jgi:HK97 family phage portal protein
MATIVSWVVDGNAYWLKVRSAAGRVVQLWYVPHWMIEPIWPLDGSEYISYYQYRVGSQSVPIAPRDIVHFRYGLDPDNPRKGRSPLSAVLREVYTDEEAARFSASILKNLGLPGVILSPAKGAPAPRTGQTDLDAIKEKFRETFTGDNRGDVMVLGAPTDVQMFGFSPQQLDLSQLRNVPEERVTAALGIPAAVVGFGSGLQQTKVGATMESLRDQAWQSNLIPSQGILGGEVQTQLVPEFEADIELNEFGFDLSRVGVFQDAMSKKATMWRTLTDGKIAKRIEARAAFDLMVDPVEDDVYIDSAATATSGSPAASSSGADQQQTVDDLQQQVNDLQDQLAQAGNQS